jgi:hypothetical protein
MVKIKSGNKCVICTYGTSTRRGVVEKYAVILQAMGIYGNPYAHAKCVTSIQQQALNFRTRIARR